MTGEDPIDDRRKALRAWLTANGIRPRDVPINADLYLAPGPGGTPHIHYEAFHLTSDGHQQVDERRQRAAIERRTTPLLVEPPAWWEPHRKPTRDQLLTLMASLRKLVDDGPPTNLAVWGEWENGYSSALDAVQTALETKEPS
ncbi:hypothetical protein ACFQ0X_43885 [Streptomyces rectiviolaceus]|uniref:Uncharacterized protein n=1 Tax=Streptomyces rectiviolaceus TaxID=332591 RepID=A0ABP6NMX0_9ACTN